MIPTKKVDWLLLLLFTIVIIAFSVEAYFVSKVGFIGSSDPAHYSEVAENVILGKGFVMDYINQYLYKFDSITHPEEYGFPGVSLLMMPFILLLGKTVFAIKLPSMIIGIILFPILVYYLGKEFFNERIGFLAAVSMIFYPTIFHLSFGGERDTMFAFFVVAGIYFFYRGLKTDEIKYFLLMGAFLGFSYLIRQAAIAVLPVIFIAYYLTKKNFSMKFVYGLIVGGLIVSPWLLRNYLVFGSPFFTINKYAGWVMGYAGYFEPGFFRVYWETQKPGPALIIQLVGLAGFAKIYFGRLTNSIVEQYHNFIVLNTLAFFALGALQKKGLSRKFTRLIVFVAASGIATFFFGYFIWMGFMALVPWFIHAAPSLGMPAYWVILIAPYLGMLAISVVFFRKRSIENNIFVLMWVFYAIFFGVLWVTDVRYWTAIVPFLLVYSWVIVEKMLQKMPVKRAQHPFLQKVWSALVVILLIFIVISVPQTFGKFVDKNAAFPYGDDGAARLKMQVAEKIKMETPPDAVIMGCDVGVMHYYSGRQYLEFPSGHVANIWKVAREYNVKYFNLVGCERRGIDREFFNIVFANREFLQKDYDKGSVEFISGDYGNNDEQRFQIPVSELFVVHKLNVKEA